MNKTRELLEMGDFYASTVLTEAKKNFPPKDTFKLATDKKPVEAQAKKDAFVSTPSGPAEASNFKADLIDTKNAKIKKDNFYEPEKFTQEIGKIQKENINTFMNKSIFDRLYEDVLSNNTPDYSPEEVETADAEALGVGDSEVEEGEVTITLDKELAKKLHDVLMSVLGDEEGSDELEDLEDETSEDEEVGGDSEGTAFEATQIEELHDSKGHSLTSKNNKVGDETSRLTSKGEGEGKIKDQCDAEGTELPASKGHTLTSKNNKVASKTSKVGSYVAGLK